MLNYFKNKRRLKSAQSIAQVFFASLFNFLDLDTNKLPIKLKDDSFIMAYIYGVIGFISVISRIDDIVQKGLLIYDVYEILFPGYGKEITEKCNQLVKSENAQFLSTVQKAQAEIESVYKNKGNSKLISLEKYLENNYPED